MTKITKYYENIDINGALSIKDGTQADGYILMSDSGGTATWVSQTSLSGSSGTGITIANTVFVSKNGSDSTGVVEKITKPFLTISAATTALNNAYPVSARTGTVRYLVQVGSGYYTERIVLSNYTDYDLGDATIELVSGTTSYTIDDNNVACDSIIYGKPQLIRSTAGSGGCVRTQHSATTLTIYANTISTTIGVGVSCVSGTQYIYTSGGVSSTANDGVTCSGGIQNIFGDASTAGCSGGIQVVRGNVSSTLFRAVGCFGGTQYIYGNATTSANGNGASCSSGTQYIYGNVSCTNSAGTVSASAAVCTGGVQNIVGDIYTAAVDASAYGIRFQTTSSGSTYQGNISCALAQPISISTGGSMMLRPGSKVLTNSSGRVGITCPSGTPVLILDNVTIVTLDSASVSGTMTVKVYGTCQANFAVSGGITQQVGSIIVDTNVS